MFKVVPFFQKHFRKYSLPSYIHHNTSSFIPSSLVGHGPPNMPRRSSSDIKVRSFNINVESKLENGTEENSCDEVLSRLKHHLTPLEKITLIKTRTVRKTLGFHTDSGITVTEYEMIDETENKVFDIEVQQGHLLKEFEIKLFDPEDDTLLCKMDLEGNLEMKTVVLKISFPSHELIGSVHEMKGMGKTTFIKNAGGELVYQVFTHRGLGGFGWTTSAKILNPEGNEKLGDVQISRRSGSDVPSVIANLPPTSDTQILNKVLVLAACVALIKDC